MTPAVLAVLVTLSVGAASCPWWCRHRPSTARRRRRSAATSAVVHDPLDVVLLLDLVDVAVATGASVPRALAAVGAAVGGPQGDALSRGGSALLLGASWQSAWAGAEVADAVGALEASWATGSAPGPSLRAQADRLRRDRHTRTRAAAGALGVRLVLPLGLCFLPAFILLGLVPMLLSLAGDLLG